METKQIYIEEQTSPVIIAEKPLQVKEWFAAKKFREIRKSGLYDNRVFAIFAESEKAYNCLVGGLGRIINTWVPKSVVETADDETTQRTFVCKGYTEAYNLLQNVRDYWH